MYSGGYCGGGGHSGGQTYAASPLETMAMGYSPGSPQYAPSAASYAGASSGYAAASGSYGLPSQAHYAMRHETASAAFSADDFLDPFRPPTPFVGKAEELAPYVEEAFAKLMGAGLPRDIIVRLGTDEQLAKAYPGDWDTSIQGFALNRVGWGTSEIFVKQNDLDRLLLTVGHELGHVMSQPLPAIHDEEAKAFAFSLAWMKTIKDNNIAGIAHAINPNPAHNGLHDIAFEFVASLIERGMAAMDVFSKLVQRCMTVR